MRVVTSKQVSVFVTLIIITNIISIMGNTPENANLQFSTHEPIPIKFWPANPEVYTIASSRIFPMVSLDTDQSLFNLGMAWITWTIEVNGKFWAAWAIYNHGRVSNYTLLNQYFEEVYWNGIQQELFLITSTNSETFFTWYSYRQDSFGYKLPYNSSNHEMFIKDENHIEFFLYQNGTTPALIDVSIDGFQSSITTQSTNDTLISSTPGMGLFLLPDQSLQLVTAESIDVLPQGFSNQSQIGHLLLAPAVFDTISGKIWLQSDNSTIDLPQNSTAIFPVGLSSSIVLTTTNDLLEYTPFGWKAIGQFDKSYQIQYYSLVDIDLYLGTVVDDGLHLLTSGLDTDQDQIPDTMEDYYFTLPNTVDTDKDGISDGIEIAFGLNPLIDDTNFDSDADGLLNVDELRYQTDPSYHDSDFGGALDGWEVKYDFDPLNSTDDDLDPDGDTVTNDIESIWDTNPRSTDSDNDSLPDSWEIKYSLDPMDPSNANADPDRDGFSNKQEFQEGTDPLIPNPIPVFDGLLIWMVPLIILFLPISFKFWKRIVDNKSD
ncbi:MAG: hypothetical protein ACXAB7_08195 [Candidatus Kariarchaeaceae archaeon]|jgi:hypothetical protein